MISCSNSLYEKYRKQHLTCLRNLLYLKRQLPFYYEEKLLKNYTFHEKNTKHKIISSICIPNYIKRNIYNGKETKENINIILNSRVLECKECNRFGIHIPGEFMYFI